MLDFRVYLACDYTPLVIIVAAQGTVTPKMKGQFRVHPQDY